MAENPLMNTYGKLPVDLVRGEGVWAFDTDGRRYLDTFSGAGVTTLGHANPAITSAITKQASQLIHTANAFHNPAQRDFARALCDITGLERVFFSNSGAEANEAAIKLARLHGHRRGISSPIIVVMERAFHGRTMATLSASANRKVQAGFEPLLKGFVRIPFNDVKALQNVAASNPNIVAVMLEPIQSEGGVWPASQGYLQEVRTLCNQHDWLFIADETQSGGGRTGTYLAVQKHQVMPDVVTLANGLGNGFPIGACLARGEAASAFTPGTHGSTFGGNPLACAVGKAVLTTVLDGNLMARATQLGNQLLSRFSEHFGGTRYVRDIRGQGLMLGIEMEDPCPELVLLAKTQGLLLNVTTENVIRLLPALTISDDDTHALADQLIRLIKLYAGDDRERPRRH